MTALGVVKLGVGSLVLAVMVAPALTVRAQSQPDRSKPPSLGPTPQLKLPAIQKRTLSNGVPVWLVEQREVPLVRVTLLLKSGGSDDPSGKFGLASLTAAMLDEGAGARSALEIADEIEFLGADLTTSSLFDASAVRLGVPVARLGPALAVMADVALRPTFPDAELERVRQERLTDLIQARDDAASVAPMAFARLLFGPTHRYGTGAIGTAATLKAFTTADLKAFHAAAFQPGNATLIAVGDITADSVVPQLEKHFGSWRAGSTAARHAAVPNASQPAQRQITIVDMPGAEQSQVRIGWVGVARSTQDYFTLQVLNTILGGSFTSRLNQNLREEHGYSYGASSRFDMRLSAGPFFAGAGVQTDKTAESIREFFNELTAIGKPVAADELTKAKNYVAFGFPSNFETIGDLSAQLEQLIVYGLPDTYYADYVRNLQAVTADAVLKASATYIQPQKFLVVVVGDGKVIEPGIRALNLGMVRTISIQEALGE
ncbi:MAG TPA: pitrilysin family protein [Vicinamibacterales bacterium]|nr:pitrilysin family protein [Vicinamibacterales bacterium]